MTGMSRLGFRTVTVATSLGLLIALAACDRDATSSAPPPPGAKPFRLIGKLADERGNPLSNVTVSIFGFSEKGEAVNRQVFVAGPAREYDMELPEGKYATPMARVGVEYNDRWYELPLAAADGTREWTEQKDSRRGLVRDFVWRISGPIPGGQTNAPAGYWGGSVHFDKAGELGDFATIDIVLKPVGPLIDGSEGKPLAFTRRIPWEKPDDHYLIDIPIGKYTASARQAFGTKPKPLRLVSYTVDPANLEPQTAERTPAATATIEFEQSEPKPDEFKLLAPNLVAFPPK
jgi:hypothetical protein